MKVIPNIIKKQDKIICYFEVDYAKGLEIKNKLDTHNFEFDILDKRPKTYEQIKLFWGFLNEFCQFYYKERKLDKEMLDNIKIALYDEFKEEKGINISLSKTNVTNARLFLDWVIVKFADEYNFVSNNLELQNEFNGSYVYSTILASKCAICGNLGDLISFNDKKICLCEKHKNLTKKELNNTYYLEPIKIKEI